MARSLSALSSYFTELDDLGDVLVQTLDGWRTPAVIVFGGESSGKSTILERITMLRLFPTDTNICTRMPIYLKLRYARLPGRARLRVVRNRDGVVTGGPPGTIDITRGGADVIRTWMHKVLRSQNSKVAGISSEEHLCLEMSGPDLPCIDVVDLPGIVS